MSQLKIISFENDRLILLDQRKLPHRVCYVRIKNSEETSDAIKDMVARGAPLIGITSCYGYALGCIEEVFASNADLIKHMDMVKQRLLNSRPTAVNLKWALDKMEGKFNSLKGLTQNEIFKGLVDTADNLKESEIQANEKMGEYGAKLLKKISRKKGKLNILSHCNAGALATGGWGTALGVIRSAFNKGIVKMVYVDETRPRLQGARLTCFELKEAGIPYTLICDNMSGLLMRQKRIDVAIVGADRIASNGDVANKIGTYMVAVLAKYHRIPFYVAAPESTFDFNTPEGDNIEIETRDEEEVLFIGKERISPQETRVENLAFDITPQKFVAAYITEKGVIKKPDELQ